MSTNHRSNAFLRAAHIICIETECNDMKQNVSSECDAMAKDVHLPVLKNELLKIALTAQPF